MKKIFCFLLTLALLIAICVTAAAAEDVPAVAHWKFQKLNGCYSGELTKDNLVFYDLTGNGNDLTVAAEGFGKDLFVLEWDEGCNIGASTGSTSLLMNNSKENSASVDPYPADKTSYTGGHTSGKYLQTVKGAPMNAMPFSGAYTIEVIFKFSPDFNNDYNRYCGIFSRQGVVADQNEPPISLAATELSNGTVLGDSDTIGIQYVHIDAAGTKTNAEMENGVLEADQWLHYMIVNDGKGQTNAYLNGEPVGEFFEESGIYVTDPSYRWEVGVGRKNGEGHVGTDTQNADHPEGMIRRLFCGSVSEIRVTEKALTVEQSLFKSAVHYEMEAQPMMMDEVVTIAPDGTVTTTTVISPATWDVSTIAALSAIVSLAAAAISKKRR